MSIVDRVRRIMPGGKISASVNNQTRVMNDRLQEIVQGLDNQNNLLNERLQAILQGSANQSELLNERLKEIVEGLDNQSRLLALGFDKLTKGSDNQSELLHIKFEKVIEGIKSQSQLFNRKITEVIRGLENLSAELNNSDGPGNTLRRDQTAQLTGSRPNRGTTSIVDRHSSLPAKKQNTERIAWEAGADASGTVDLEAFRNVFAGIKPWSGTVPHKFIADFLGMLIDIDFHPMLFTDPDFDAEVVGGKFEQTVVPRLEDAITPGDAEAWFETVDWVISAREARDHYVMITLGANYGAQAVAAYRALQTVNPMPCKLVAVDPVPGNVDWIRQHMINNDIDPDQHWIVPLAISDSVEPLFFPVGGPGVGSNNAYSTNERGARVQYADEFIANGRAEEALRNLLVKNTTGLATDLVPGHSFMAEIKLVSSITLNELLGPFKMVDLLESDIQQSEILVFPPFMDLLRRKVRRIHIGTHGEDVHAELHDLFLENGWEVVFNFKPNSKFHSTMGDFETNDGVLTVRNPHL